MFVEKIFDKIQQVLIEYFLPTGTNMALTLNPLKKFCPVWAGVYWKEIEELDWEWLGSEHYWEKMESQWDYGMVQGS